MPDTSNPVEIHLDTVRGEKTGGGGCDWSIGGPGGGLRTTMTMQAGGTRTGGISSRDPLQLESREQASITSAIRDCQAAPGEVAY